MPWLYKKQFFLSYKNEAISRTLNPKLVKAFIKGHTKWTSVKSPQHQEHCMTVFLSLAYFSDRIDYRYHRSTYRYTSISSFPELVNIYLSAEIVQVLYWAKCFHCVMCKSIAIMWFFKRKGKVLTRGKEDGTLLNAFQYRSGKCSSL